MKLKTMRLLLLLLLATVKAQECPEECQCHIEGLKLFADCSSAQLNSLPDFQYKNVSALSVYKGNINSRLSLSL